MLQCFCMFVFCYYFCLFRKHYVSSNNFFFVFFFIILNDNLFFFCSDVHTIAWQQIVEWIFKWFFWVCVGAQSIRIHLVPFAVHRLAAYHTQWYKRNIWKKKKKTGFAVHFALWAFKFKITFGHSPLHA